jgi:cell pole-organizing protein PopZ
LAAAGLGAAAAAGSGVANAIKSERQSPTVGETDDIVSLTDSADMAMEDLDLVLDDVSGNHNDQTEDKAAQLETSSASDEEDPIDDLDRLLNSMLGDSPAAEPEPEPEPEAEFVVDPAADLIAETRDADEGEDIDDLLSDLLGEDGEVEDSGVLELDGQDLGESKPQSDPDLDLVKSLMADLTDDPYPDNSAPETVSALDDLKDPDDLEDNVIDEILELSMEDEENLQQNSGSDVDIADLVAPLPEPEAADEAVQDNSPFFIDINADLSKPETAKPSLSDIAKSTKAEAERIKNQGFSTGQFAAGAGVAVAASGPLAALVKNNKAAEVQEAANKDDTAAAVTEPAEEKEPEATNSATETKSKKTIATPLKETADMPKASAKDTIVDNATEDATASAFASLNKVIDEKTTMAERGDRIGDLVQEALRPMLKEWLDKNLKGIVERAVTKEVKRISSGK